MKELIAALLSPTYVAYNIICPSQLAFYINLQRAVIGPSVILTGR